MCNAEEQLSLKYDNCIKYLKTSEKSYEEIAKICCLDVNIVEKLDKKHKIRFYPGSVIYSKIVNDLRNTCLSMISIASRYNTKYSNVYRINGTERIRKAGYGKSNASRELTKDIISLIKKGYKYTEIIDELGCSTNQITKAKYQAGQIITDEQQKIINLAMSGYTKQQICKIMNINKVKLNKIYAKYNLTYKLKLKKAR